MEFCCLPSYVVSTQKQPGWLLPKGVPGRSFLFIYSHAHQSCTDRLKVAPCFSRLSSRTRVIGLQRHVLAAAISSTTEDHPVALTVHHNIQDGDTLTSIAKQYKTSVQSIALANNIKNPDLLYAGQVLLIPVHPRVFQKVTALVMGFDEIGNPSLVQRSVSPVVSLPNSENILHSELQAPVGVKFPSTFVDFAKMAAPVLFLAPILGFCLRCLVDNLYGKLKTELMHAQAEKEVFDVHHRPKVKRWHTILQEDRETEILLPAGEKKDWIEPEEPETEEQRKQREYEEMCQSYTDLEATYTKFLADSGLAKSGYWRGGV